MIKYLYLRVAIILVLVLSITMAECDGKTSKMTPKPTSKLSPTSTPSSVSWAGIKQMGSSSQDQSTGVTVDGSGNVYVTGWTTGGLDENSNAGGPDIFLAKYDSSGTKQWAKQLGTSEEDQACGVAVDSSDNVYVAGYTRGELDGNTNAGGSDIYLVKYNSSGTKQWTKQLGGLGDEIVNGVTVDHSGNVYIAGGTNRGLDGYPLAGDFDIFLVKYDSSGTKQWAKQLGSSEEDQACGVAVDSSDNVYVAGYTKGGLDKYISDGSFSMFLVKYDSSGTKQWTKQLGSSGGDWACGVTVDSSDNVYVAGYTNDGIVKTNTGGYDMFLVKYDSSGTRQWVNQLGGSGNDWANGVTVDGSGNVYVTGPTNGGLDGNTNAGSYDMFLVKYDSSGAKQWTKQLGTSEEDYASGVTVDSSDNVYVVGFTLGGLDGNTNAGGCDIFLVKFNASEVKQKVFDGNSSIPTSSPVSWSGIKQLGSRDGDYTKGVTVDGSGNVYVVGETLARFDGNTHLGLWDMFLVKYDSSGTKRWTKQVGTSEDDSAYGVTMDGSDNVYVAGWTGGGLDGNTNAGGNDIFLVKYDASGTKKWTKQVGTSEDDIAYGVTVDSSGNVYVAGSTEGGLDGNTNAGGSDMFLVKYNVSGTKKWTKQLGSSGDDWATGVTVDGSGNVYVAGQTNGGLDGNTNAGGSDMFLVKYNGSGTKQWTRQLGSAKTDNAYGVVVDSSNNVYVTGSTGGGLDGNTNAGNNDMILVKYNASGTKQWTRQLGTSAHDRASGVTVDSSDNVFVTGSTEGGLDGNTKAGGSDMFLVKYDASGAKQCTKQLGSRGWDVADGVTVDGSGNVYVAGKTLGGLDGNTNAGDYDMFLVKFNASEVKQ